MAEMMKGNEAIAEAAIRAGARFYAGYRLHHPVKLWNIYHGE